MKFSNLKIVLALSFLLFSCGHVRHEKFDSNKWKNSSMSIEENWDLRWNMMNDLRNNYKLKGKSKTEIILLLGKPDYEHGNDLIYGLGYTGTGINTGNLTLTFDKKEKVEKIIVREG